MGSSETPEAPPYQGGISRIGGRDVSRNYKQGNDIVTETYTTPEEQAAYQYTQSQLLPLYQKAMTTQDFSGYADAYKQNQLAQLDKSYRQGLNTAKGALVSSGQSSGSQGLDKLTAFNQPYMEQQATINANAPLQAQQMQVTDAALNSSLMANAQNALNNYYQTGQQFGNQANALSNMGNQWAATNFQQQMQAAQMQQAQQAALLSAGLQGVGMLGGALGSMGSFGGFGGSAGGGIGGSKISGGGFGETGGIVLA